MIATKLPNTPERIVVLRALGGLGDFLCAVPTLRSIRMAFPEAQISLIGLDRTRFLAERFKNYIDHFWEFPGFPGIPEAPMHLETIPFFLIMAQRNDFDLAIQLHGSGPITNPLTMLLGAKTSAGFYLPGQYCPDESTFLVFDEGESEVRRGLRLLEFLGIHTQGEELEFPIVGSDFESIDAIDKVKELKNEYICIHPGASDFKRCWPIENFAIVADTLAAMGYQIVFTGVESEIELVESIVEKMTFPSINFAGRTELGTLAILLKESRLLVCNDTGVSHLGSALQVKSSVIFLKNNYNRWAPLDRNLHHIIHDDREVTPDRVIKSAKYLLENN